MKLFQAVKMNNVAEPNIFFLMMRGLYQLYKARLDLGVTDCFEL